MTTPLGQMLPDALRVRPADRGERGCIYQLLAFPVVDHFQCLNYTRIQSTLGSSKAAGGINVISVLDQQYVYNMGGGSIGLDVAHAGMPRSFFFRAQWFF